MCGVLRRRIKRRVPVQVNRRCVVSCGKKNKTRRLTRAETRRASCCVQWTVLDASGVAFLVASMGASYRVKQEDLHAQRRAARQSCEQGLPADAAAPGWFNVHKSWKRVRVKMAERFYGFMQIGRKTRD